VRRRPHPSSAVRPLIDHATATWRATDALLAARLSRYIRLIAPTRRGRSARDELGRLSRADLYAEATQLGIPGRSKMKRHELAEAIRRAHEGDRSPNVLDRCRAGLAIASRHTDAVRRLTRFAGPGRVVSALRMPQPARVLILSLAMLAAGGLGLMVAHAVAGEEDLTAQVLVTNGRTLRLVTVTGADRTMTLAVTKTKQGKTKLVPVRILRTVTGPGGTRTLVVPLPGSPITRVVTELRESTETQVVTQVEPVTVVVTNVVTQSETSVVTDTVVIEVTVTVPP
jgi:hypothetical protein